MIRRKKAPELIFVVLIFVTALRPGQARYACAALRAPNIRTYIIYMYISHTPSDPPGDRGAPQLADVFIAMEKFLSSLVCAGITFTVTYGKLVLDNSCLVNGKREKEPCYLSIIVNTYERLAGRLSSYAVGHAHQYPVAPVLYACARLLSLIFVGGNFRDCRVNHENHEN